MQKKFQQLRPFFMSRGIEQLSNGIWTIELYNRPSGFPEVRFESKDGASNWGSPNTHDGVWRYDNPYAIPAYVKAEAVKMYGRVWK